MKATWTNNDEKEFQKLLTRRRKAAAVKITELKLTVDEINGLSDDGEGTDPQDVWTDFIEWSSPAEVEDAVEYLRA